MPPPLSSTFTTIRRSRPSYSCESCRSRRVKCDQLRPKCTNCASHHIECIYSSEASKRKRDDDSSDVASGSGDRPVKKQSMEGAQDNPRPGYLVLQNGGRSRYTENTFWACVDAKGLQLDSLLPDLPLFPLDDGGLAAHGDATERGGPTQGQYHYDGTAEPHFSYWTSGNRTSLISRATELASILEGLPPRDICDHLVGAFLENIHPLIPLVHTPTFKSFYEQFWPWRSGWVVTQSPTGVLAENPSFLPLLIGVLFAGSVSVGSLDGMVAPALQVKLRGMITRSLSMVGFPQNPSLYALMAFILSNSMMMREEEALSSCSFVAVALRIAQAMGLHKDGALFGLDPVNIEERRRVWWHLMHLDAMTSIVSGLPLVASNMLSNTHMIGELKDEYIGNSQATQDADSGAFVDSIYVLSVGRYDASACIRHILIQQSSSESMGLTSIAALDKEIVQLKDRMDRRIQRLETLEQDEGGGHSTDSSSGRGNVGLDAHLTAHSQIKLWGKELLILMVEKARCILYQPTMQDRIWKELRPRAIPQFQQFLSTFLDMCTNSSYRTYHWLYPGTYQPLQPVAALLVDLSNYSSSPEAATSQALIERTFSLVGPNGRLTNGIFDPATATWQNKRHSSAGAQQAWAILEKLRCKVWQALGLDPNVNWLRTIEPLSYHSRSPTSHEPLVHHSSEQRSTSTMQQQQVYLQGSGAVNPSSAHVLGPENTFDVSQVASTSNQDFFTIPEDQRFPVDALEGIWDYDSSLGDPLSQLFGFGSMGEDGSTDDAFSELRRMSSSTQ